jgi:hypothetical protein
MLLFLGVLLIVMLFLGTLFCDLTPACRTRNYYLMFQNKLVSFFQLIFFFFFAFCVCVLCFCKINLYQSVAKIVL